MANGYYSLSFATLQGLGSARIRVEHGRVTGKTERGVAIEGWCRPCTVRKLALFELVAHLPPNFVAITGHATDDSPRMIRFKGEAGTSEPNFRLSVDFAGRAIDISARYEGPL